MLYNNMKKLILLLGVCMALDLTAQENTGYAFTLEEAKAFALENNNTVKNARLDVEAAEKKVWETTAIGLPQVNASVNYQYIPGDIPEISFLDSNVFPGLPADAYKKQPIAVKEAITYGATVSQLIFSGEYIVGLQASRTYKQISENSSEKTLLVTKENVSNAYFSILVLEKNLENLDSTIVNMTKLVRQNKLMQEQGFVENIDVKQLELNLNTIKNTRNTLKRQIDISYLLFKIQIGLDTKAPVQLKDNLEEVMIKVNNLNYDTANFDLTQNIDYQILQIQEDISNLSLKRLKSTYLPTLSAFYQYQDKTEKASFDFTIKHVIGAQLNIPIFSSGQRNAQVAQAKIELEQTRNTNELMGNNILVGVTESLNAYNNAIDKYITAQTNVDISKEIYDDTELKYTNGMASSMELTQANTQYLQSYSDYVTAILEVLSAKTSLDSKYNNL
jgi:outer membrane protein